MPATKKSTSKKTSGRKPVGTDFKAVFAGLQKILTPYKNRLAEKLLGPDYYWLESREPTYKNRPMSFAAVRTGKSYVSFHLVPVYASPELNKTISPALKKRMQGKACFNFTAVDPELFEELAKLTEVGYRAFKDKGWL